VTDRLAEVGQGAFSRLLAELDAFGRAVNSNSPMAASFGAIITSGGSPASRARAMRSWVMLNASIITAAMPGASLGR